MKQKIKNILFSKNFHKVLFVTSLAVIVGVLHVTVGTKISPAQAARVTVTCSNSSGDASTINTAIAGSSVGDEIVFDGPCLINTTIKLLGDRSYRGESRTGTVLKQANSANLAAVLASDSYIDNSSTTGNPISIRQLTIDGNKDNNTGTTSGMIIRSWQSTVEDV